MWEILSRFFEALFPRRRKEWFQNVNLPGGEKERYQNGKSFFHKLRGEFMF